MKSPLHTNPPHSGRRHTRRLSGGSSVSSNSRIPEEEEEEAPAAVDEADDTPNIIKILSMNGYRDTRSWDALTGKIKRRVVAPRRSGLDIPRYPSMDDEDADNAVGPRLPRPLTAEEHMQKRLRENAELDDRKIRAPLTLSDVAHFDQPDIQSNFCFKCWMLVAAAPVGLSCQYCPVIAHRHCVDVLQVQAKKNLLAIRQRHALDLDEFDGSGSMSEFDDESAVSTPTVQSPRNGFSKNSNSFREMTAEELNLKWVCPFCIEILHDANDYKDMKDNTAIDIVRTGKLSTSIGAQARMFVARKRWISRVKNSIKIQRFIRSRSTLFSLRNELRVTKSVIRVGLYQLELRLVVTVSTILLYYCTTILLYYCTTVLLYYCTTVVVYTLCVGVGVFYDI
jgi:hypothetical protein